MTDMVGKILHNRYKILRPVGVGGMAGGFLLFLFQNSQAPGQGGKSYCRFFFEKKKKNDGRNYVFRVYMYIVKD